MSDDGSAVDGLFTPAGSAGRGGGAPSGNAPMSPGLPSNSPGFGPTGSVFAPGASGFAPVNGAPGGAISAVSPPIGYLLGALALALVALAAGLLWGENPIIAGISWFAGGIGCFCLAALFVYVDTGRRTSIGYSRRSTGVITALHTAVIVLGLAAVCVAALHLAFWFGRL